MSAPYILQLNQIEVIYDQVILAVKNVSLAVRQGSIVALLGANGAGKSTTLKAIAGLVRAEIGEVVQGRIYYQGLDITHAAAADLVNQGLVQVLEGRHCFPHLTVEENLYSGAFARKPRAVELNQALERIYHYFPRLLKLRKNQAGYTSGGEQQMVAIGRALMANPKLVLLDEPSMGLAPLMVEEIFQIVHQLNQEEKVSFLLSEQNATVALQYAHYGYIIENGRVAAEGETKVLSVRDDLQSLYLGL
ncbi:amino acid/amide ABC transporter ATP-binding protein 2, HAAT family [Methylobacillus rhizosphaerae]|uniref:Amino acid/amide ABC transporter ATP-binding protein 2, HAAT family n=2 Tax=Methylobacillus rhizosphaerae TaxID=551994 RepID=A0A238ZMF8_9PROT|nr:amino acid/amide ABC transporter ATP-binding protein 2, HAAT family [Methylobacillus rhizosphaerae]